MRFQLVLQWPSDSVDTYEEAVAAEAQLIDADLPDIELDGHDVGSGSMNVFIWTESPEAAFSLVRELLGSESSWREVKAGVRREDEDHYRPVWPEGLPAFDVL